MQIFHACVVADLPLIRQPLQELANGQGGQVDQQLGEVELRIDVMTATGACQAGEDGRRSAAARIADEQAVLPVQNHTFHLPLADIMPTAGLCRIRQSGVMIYG
ncbi:MAG TPA: hypothetical protein VMV98_05835 [Acidobacteriaceae bacterium]|nr:hypothetical protein [Acidobacteriaceae bacterium]